MDTDYLVLDNSLLNYFNTSWDYLIPNRNINLGQDEFTDTMGMYSLPFVWATVIMFRKTDKVPKAPFLIEKSRITNKAATIKLDDLAYGAYAAIIFHDTNMNGIIDHHWGIPAELLGYTNHWRLTMLSGMPTFDKLKFSFAAVSDTMAIQMQ